MKKVIKFSIPVSTLALSIAHALNLPEVNMTIHYGLWSDAGSEAVTLNNTNKNDYIRGEGNILSGNIIRMNNYNSLQAGIWRYDELKNNPILMNRSSIIGNNIISSENNYYNGDDIDGKNKINDSLIWGNNNFSQPDTTERLKERFNYQYGYTTHILSSSIVGSNTVKQFHSDTSDERGSDLIPLGVQILSSQINGQGNTFTPSTYRAVSLLGGGMKLVPVNHVVVM